MATVTTGNLQIRMDTPNDTEFRQALQGIHDALSSVGLVQTSDTGQVNLSTVTRGACYEVWRFNDTASATKPIYLRFDYSVMSTYYVNLTITVGRGSDGSGSLTGTFAYLYIFSGSYHYAGPLKMSMSDAGFFMWATGGSNKWIATVHRRSASNPGDVITACTSMSSGEQQINLNVYPETAFTGTTIGGQMQLYALPAGRIGSQDGNAVELFPIRIRWVDGTVEKHPAMLIGYPSEVSNGATLTVAHNGATRTFIGTDKYATGANNDRLLFLWE